MTLYYVGQRVRRSKEFHARCVIGVRIFERYGLEGIVVSYSRILVRVLWDKALYDYAYPHDWIVPHNCEPLTKEGVLGDI